MGRRIIDFGEKKTTKKEFYSDDNKKIFNTNDININEILISKGLFPSLNLNEYVIGYKHNQNIKPLYIKLPEYVWRGNTFKNIETYLLKLTMLILLKNTVKYGKRLRN